MNGIFTIKLMVPTPNGSFSFVTVYTERDIPEVEARESFARWEAQNPSLAGNARGEWTTRVIL